MDIQIQQTSHGIPWCLNCVGFHPDHNPTYRDMAERMLAPQANILKSARMFQKKTHLYKDKVCCLCGRAYDHSGNLDESWELTAKFVKLELDHAGVFGVSDSNIKKIVANCRRAVSELFNHIPTLQALIHMGKPLSVDDIEVFNRLTFSGRLNTIIEHAQEGRQVKLAGHKQAVR